METSHKNVPLFDRWDIDAEEDGVEIKEDDSSNLSSSYDNVVELTYDGYYKQLLNRINDLYTGVIDVSGFLDAMQVLIESQLTKAFRAAMKDNQIDPKILSESNDFSQALNEMILSEYDYVDNLASDVQTAKNGLTGVSAFGARARMWANRYSQAYNTCVGMISEIEGGKLKWVYDDQKVHCPECLALNGIVARASEWSQLGLNPPNTPNNGKTTCNGFNCGCKLVPVTTNRSANAFNTILNIIVSKDYPS